MFTWLLHGTFLALPVAALASLVRWRRGPARLEHALWLAVLGLLVWPSWLGAAPASTAAVQGVVSSGPPTVGDRIVAGVTAALGPNWSGPLQRVLVAGFVLAATLVGARELRRVHAIRRVLRGARPAPVRWSARVARLARRAGVHAPRVVVTIEAPGPFLWALGAPVLVLPEGPTRPDDTVLLHELGHLARRDHWSAWLELVVLPLHFWNPLFHLARRRLRHAAELACDARVVALAPARRHAYASALLALAERALPAAAPPPHAAHAVTEDAGEVEERLRRILVDGGRRPDSRLAPALALALCALVPPLALPSLHRFRSAIPALPAGLDESVWTSALERADAALRIDPGDGAALQTRGLALLGLGRVDASRAAFARQIELGHEVGKALYNLACVETRAGKLSTALERLGQAEQAGWPVADTAGRDPDLAPLAGEPGFARWR